MTEIISSENTHLEKIKEEGKVNRRDFLALTWKSMLALSGALGLGGLCRFLSYQTDPAPATIFDLGPAQDIPMGANAIIIEAEAVVMHNEAGFSALSLVCPHLGCRVDMTDSGFACPCHGSRFGKDGSLQRGPADRPLRSLKVDLNDQGHLILDTSA